MFSSKDPENNSGKKRIGMFLVFKKFHGRVKAYMPWVKHVKTRTKGIEMTELKKSLFNYIKFCYMKQR